jgi:glycosyltransferase involved in cell wall biosynthesis
MPRELLHDIAMAKKKSMTIGNTNTQSLRASKCRPNALGHELLSKGHSVMDSAPRIDVLLVTCNHEKYVERALQSVYCQQYSDGFRIVVADDCSSDSTPAIIRSYARLHPEIEHVFLETPCQLGITANYQRAILSCDAEYIAILEGDDYWATPHKLQKQSDFLNEHGECAMCGSNYFIFDQDRLTYSPRVPPGNHYQLLDSQSQILDNIISNFSTCVYRSAVLKSIPEEIYSQLVYDWGINICVGMQGLLGFLNEPLSVYRVHGEAAWSPLTLCEKFEAQLIVIPHYDTITGGVFHKEFNLLERHLVDRIRIERLRQRFLRNGGRVNASLVKVAKMLVPPFLRRLILKVLGALIG